MYSYVDPCTNKLKFLSYDMTTPIVVSYYGRTRAFTADQLQNGTFESWLNTVFIENRQNPCGEVFTSQNAIFSTNLTTNVVQNVMNLTSISSLSSLNLDITGNVNSGSSQINQENSEIGTSSPNNRQKSSEISSNNSSVGSNNGEFNSSGSGSEGNPNGGSNSGSPEGSSNEETNSSYSNQEESQGLTNEEIYNIKEDQTQSGSQQITRSTSRSRTNTQKPAILLTGDVVGLQQTSDNSNDVRATFTYTRVKGDGTSSIGLSMDYMLNSRIGNLTVMRSWIGTNENGNKYIDLVSSGFSLQPGAWSSTNMFIRVNSLKKFTAIYGAAGSFGYLYQEPIFSTLLIGGFMYKGIMLKKIEATIIAAGVYAPYSLYYTETWWKSRPIVIPFFNINYKMTKTFGVGLTGGGTYLAGNNILNYQLLFGAKLIL